MASVTLRPVPENERAEFDKHFQAYLRELSVFNGVRPNRHGLFEYGLLDFYWLDAHFMPFFIQCDGARAGLLLLRELTARESPIKQRSIQVAEVTVFDEFRRRGIAREVMSNAARMARKLGLPLTWSAYMSNKPAATLYAALLEEFHDTGEWQTERTSGIDQTGLARYYYKMTPVV